MNSRTDCWYGCRKQSKCICIDQLCSVRSRQRGFLCRYRPSVRLGLKLQTVKVRGNACKRMRIIITAYRYRCCCCVARPRGLQSWWFTKCYFLRLALCSMQTANATPPPIIDTCSCSVSALLRWIMFVPSSE
jgi:hypothetical protein